MAREKLMRSMCVEAVVEEGGLLRFLLPRALSEALKPHASKKFLVYLEEWTAKRSLAQNSFYWAVIVKSIADDQKLDRQSVHEALKTKFLCEPYFLVNNQTGEIVTQVGVPRSSATLSKTEFMEYVNYCEAECADLGIRLPLFEGDKYAI